MTVRAPLTTLECAVEFVLFVREDGYTALRAATPDGAALTAVGAQLAGARPGEGLRLTGRWGEHRRHGAQFAVEECERRPPAGVPAIRRYLGSGLVRGVGPLLAQAITERFGEDTLEIIDRVPGRLSEVYGIGERRTRRITESWQAQKTIKELMSLLRGYGLSPLLAEPIHRVFGHESLKTVAREPYSMVGEVDGLAFAAADRIALQAGGALDDPARLEAAVWEVCAVRARRAGHCHLPAEQAVLEAAALTEQDPALLREAAERLTVGRGAPLSAEQHPATGEPLLAPRALRRAENKLARALALLAAAPSDLPEPVRRRVAAGQFGDGLHPGQREAVRMALTHPVSVITGGPGCGKSHTVREIVELVRAGGGSVTLAAPTGKAARRLSELTGARAVTVHRLAADPTAGEDGEEALFGPRTTMVHLIVIDEASMLDVHLAARLAAAIPPGTHLLLVGDIDQLPSVGPGCVLADVLRVPAVPRTELTHVFRQAQDSTITANAHRIRAGQPPELRRADFWFAEMDDPAQIARTVVQIATERLPAKLGADPADVQVLCPTRRGAAGTLELGRLLQDRRNPRQDNEPEYWSGSRVFRVGDRVMAARNDYAKGAAGVFNGTLGTVVDLDLKDGALAVLTDDGEQVDYDFAQLDELIHAYAVSVHKAQGSEFPHVVAPLTLDAPALLTRSLLYTLVTRARRTVVLVGQPRALRQALENPGPARNTLLAHALAAQLDAAADPD
ncbi:ATP-dependent RecD-like DNA helicase [Actinocrinis puniceicyclus]|uniref:ATP-dependent RecD2 DNA helicase n=1 Tax=Actinocrinis puniceicyclus TaxID=977794 RepID=A0A8J8BFL6_9ACTN|nr:ATP-dependent RecD-like DNA helicase [Actinocrinis puniceicyclus]MBS2966775.1 ATP-dependent RecD-like DNA helicase [Actinocrinis puniceicyclus]